MARKLLYFFVMFACVMVSCARIDDTVSSSQNDQPQIEDTENSTDEDRELVDPYPHVELTDTLRIECQGDNKEEEKKENAETEGGDDTKTYLNAQNYIYWKKGDRIKIYYADGGTNYTVSEIKHGDQQTSTFDALVDKNASYYYAFYPENIEAVMTDIAGNGAFEVVIPTTQDGKFENCHLAIGKSSAEDRSFSFKNIASYMKIVVDDLTATSLTLSARNQTDPIVGTLVAPFADKEGNLGELTLKESTGSSSVTVQLPTGRKASCTVYVALLPGINFSQGFRLHYNYGEEAGPGFIYTTNRTIERKKILNVGTLSTRIHTDWFVKTDGPVSDPNVGGNSWNNALNATGLAALLAQPVDGSGVQDDVLAYDKACMLDGARIHVAAGNYTISELLLSAVGYPKNFKVNILGGYSAGLSGTNTTASRDTTTNKTTFVGNGSSRIMGLRNRVSLSVDKVWFAGGRSAGDGQGGAAVYAWGTNINEHSTLHFTNCGFKRNIVSGLDSNGGAVSLQKSKARFDACYFYGNECGSGQIGGAIYLWDDDCFCEASINGCRFENNAAGVAGACVMVSKGNLKVNVDDDSMATSFTGSYISNRTDGSTRGCVIASKNNSQIYVKNADFSNSHGANNEKVEGAHLHFAEKVVATFENSRFTGLDNQTVYSVRNGGVATISHDSSKQGKATFKSCTFSGGRVFNVGACFHIVECSTVIMEDCTFEDNYAKTYGAVIHINNPSASCELTNCTLKNNTALSSGGAISMEDGIVTATACTFDGNTVGNGSSTTGDGGGTFSLRYHNGNTTEVGPTLHLFGCTVKNSSCKVNNNTAAGGAFYITAGTINMSNNGSTPTTISSCSAPKSFGGAIYAQSSVVGYPVALNLTGVKFDSNTAALDGGAISLKKTNASLTVTMEKCDFIKNQQTTTGTTGLGGGAVYLSDADMTVLGCNFTNNSSKVTDQTGNWKGGGAMLIAAGNSCEVRFDKASTGERSVFKGNTSAIYGAGFSNNNENATVTINYVDFIENVAQKHGGGIYWNKTNPIALNNVRFDGNSSFRGDAIATNASELAIRADNAYVAEVDNCGSYIRNHTASRAIHIPLIANLTLNNFVYYNNTSDVSGSLVHINGKKANFSITNSWIEGNTAYNKDANIKTAGGVVYADVLSSSAKSVIKNCKIVGNTVKDDSGNSYGGAIYWNAASWSNSGESEPHLRIENSTLDGNIANNSGSAVYLAKGYVYVNNCIVQNNTFTNVNSSDDERGGTFAMWHNHSKIDFYNSTAQNNKSAGKGGLFHLRGGRVFINQCKFDKNSAYSRGGVFYWGAYNYNGALSGTESERKASKGFVLIQTSSFVDNYLSNEGSDRWGKVIHANRVYDMEDSTMFMVMNSTMTDRENTSKGALINGSPNLLVYSSTLWANNENGAIRVENNRNGLLLNSIIVNQQGSAALTVGVNGYNFNSLGGYNIIGATAATGGATGYAAKTGDQTGIAVSALGGWYWNDPGNHKRLYVWDGKVNGTAVTSPAINNTNHADYFSNALMNGFDYDYIAGDGLLFRVEQPNVGSRYVTDWGVNSYYKDLWGNPRTSANHFPGALAVKP